MNRPVDFLAILLCIFPILTFALMFWRQFSLHSSNPAVYPMIILNIRSASLLPLFAIIITITVWAPNTFQAFVPLEAILEGYAVFGFYALITLNCGGPVNVVKILGTSDRIACCDCQTKGPLNCYNRVFRSVWQFVYIRPVVAVIGAVIWYLTDLDNVFLLIQGICFLQTAWMLIGLLSLAYTLYDECYGLNIVYKLLVIKISVGLVVIQGFVIDNLYAYGYITVSEKYSFSSFSEDAKIQRAYCLLCLVEFVLLCIPLWLGFAYETSPSHFYRAPEQSERDTVVGLPIDASRPLIYTDKPLFANSLGRFESDTKTFGEFACDCINVWRWKFNEFVLIPSDMSNPLLGGNGNFDQSFSGHHINS